MSKRKLSPKESKELVTKGYLNEILEKKDYSTNDRVLKVENKLDMLIEEFAIMKVQITEIGIENRQHMSALMEDNRYQISLLIEAFEARFERIERKVFG